MRVAVERSAGPDGARLRRLLRHLGKRAALRIGSGLSRLFGSCAGADFGILTYHRIAPPVGSGPAPTWNVTPRRFRAQLEGLLARGYRPRPLRELLAAGQTLPPVGTFAVTFDDGYENVYRHAWPVLEALGVPATIFLTTAYLDSASPFPFDDWPQAGSEKVAAETWRPLSSDQCAAMALGGLVEFGSHTHTHQVFRGRPQALELDLRTSAAVLRDRFGVTLPTFAFPYGIAGTELAEAARRAGMRCSLSTAAALIRPGSDPFTWGRFGVDESDTASTIAARLDGWYGLARGVWGRLRRPFAEAAG